MRDIPLDARVECIDGPGGRSVEVIINPVNQKVTHFVLENKDLPYPQQRMVPLELVQETSHDVIRLKCVTDDLAQLEPFITTHYVQQETTEYPSSFFGGEGPSYMHAYVLSSETIPVDVERIPPGELGIHRGARVEATDGRVGQVDEFLIDPDTDHITHLVMREGHLWGKKDLSLPVSAIDHVAGDVVYLKLDKKTVESLPAIPLRRSIGWEDAKIELFVMVFEEEGKADEALEFLKRKKRAEEIAGIRNAAILIKNEAGEVSLKETEDVDARHGRLFGAIAGGLIGLAGGPAGVLVGAAAGAITGKIAADRIDMGFSNKYLKDLEKHLQPGSSALIALVEHEWLSSMEDAVAYFGGHVFRQALTDEFVAEVLSRTEADDS